MRVLIVLTYFLPHKSGLTVYAVRQAQALVKRGHDVTVLTSQYDRRLPRFEENEGVRIVRLPTAFRLSKGVIMPKMPFTAWQLIGNSDVVNLHVPQVDAALVALLAKLRKKPVVMTYHCDLKMPKGWVNKLAGWVAIEAHRISAHFSDRIIHNTLDFAEHSSFLKPFLHKLTVIQPPIIVDPVTDADIKDFYEKYHIQADQHIIGMVARLATEKGVEYLVQAMPDIVQSVPDARTIFVGEYQNVFGEETYREKLLPMISELGDRWTFLDVLSEAEKAAFFHICDVLVLPSINSTESFGMVQIEAMTCGTPVVATDLPGVRQPVLSTGMGRIVPIRNSDALATAINQVLKGVDWIDPHAEHALKRFYSPETVAEAYEDLYQDLITNHG